MKIAIAASYAKSLLNFRGPLVASLRSAGHEVVACASGADAATLSGLQSLGVTYHEVGLERRGRDPFADIGYWLELRRVLRLEQPDLLFAYTMKPVVYSAFAAWGSRRRARYALISGIGSAFGSQPTGGEGSTSRLLRWMVKAALRGSNGVIFQNDDDRQLFDTLGFTRGIRTLVVRGSGVDLARFPFVPVPSGPPRFLLLSRMLRPKGVALFVDAARTIRESYPGVQCVMAGRVEPGPDAIAPAELDAWRATGHVEYLGALDDVRSELARCTAIVLPSYYREGTPRSLLEGMSTGRAVVTTDAPGCRDTVFDAGQSDDLGVRSGRNGFLIPARSVEALVEALRRLVEDPSLAVRLGAEGRRLAEQHYDVHRIDRQLMDFMGIAHSQ